MKNIKFRRIGAKIRSNKGVLEELKQISSVIESLTFLKPNTATIEVLKDKTSSYGENLDVIIYNSPLNFNSSINDLEKLNLENYLTFTVCDLINKVFKENVLYAIVE